MSNVKVRPNGWYLGRWSENSRLTVYYIYCNKVTVDGETKTTIEWEDLLGLRRGLINSRIHAGWDKETACKPQLGRVR